MNKKGFTLIELLAVVTIIALLSILVLPNIVGNVEKKKGEISDANMKLLASATNIYIENNSDRYARSFEANGSTYCIPIQSLINDNVLEAPFRDVNGDEIDYSMVVRAIYNDSYNSFDYQLVNASQCTEFVNYVNKPDLDDNMIPVVYENNKWIKADINTKWYNYKDKNWANAVYVREFRDVNVNDSKNRYDYKNSLPGTEILESDILAFFVWIPRFRYQLFTNNEQTINIAFESTNTPKSSGIAKGQWLTHPAFTSGNHELSGIWVAKYESSNTDNNITIKKDKTPWTNINYNDVNQISYDMSSDGNIYGITKNTHLIKNSEWSAVTYLASSVYGLNEKIETNSATTTGNTNSTTGNNTGVFDMSGLSSEFVYTMNENESDLGQSLIETNNWYNDTNTFTTTENQYLIRGNTSIFNYENSKINNDNTSFRVALTNTNSKPNYYKPYQITFDPNGGEVEQTQKLVTYNSNYGDLPTPTREGYTFMGWSRNLADEINNTNYSVYHYNSRTTHEFKNDGNFNGLTNQPYIRIHGISNEQIDTLWQINSITQVNVISKKKYKLSFLVRSEHARLNQIINRPNAEDTAGKTKIVWNNNTISSISEPISFLNDGNWHLIEIDITVPDEVVSGTIYIGNDWPNLDGPNNYFDIANIQFAEDSAITPYYITSTTTVASQESHTLYAKWQAN